VIQIALGDQQLKRLAKRVRLAAELTSRERGRFAKELAKGIKAIAEKRVRTTKKDPDGQPWRPWSNSYARTRGAQHSLLIDKRKLVRRFNAYASPAGRFLKVWNSAPYAGYVQAKRPFLGIGRLEDELVHRLAERFFRQVLR